MTCDLDQRRKKKIGDVEITLLPEYVNDHRHKHPNLGKIEYASEDSQFKVGQEVLCKHFTFESGDHESNEFVETDGTKYFLVNNFNVMFGIDGDELVPRKGVLLCEPVYGNLLRSEIILAGDIEGRRRDIARVLRVGEGVSGINEGDYVMLTIGGDYEFEWKGKTYIKVDTQYGDAYATSDSPDTYDSVLTKHYKHGKILNA